MIERLRRALRLEDALLVAWLALVEPVLFPPVDEAVALTPNVFEGVLGTVALLGFAACVGGRATPGVETGLGSAQPFIIGPLLGALSFVVADTTNDLGIVGAGPLVVVGLLVVAIVARLRLPPLDAIRRRALVTPFVLLAGGSFGQFVGAFDDLFDVGSFLRDLEASGLDLGLGLFLASLVVLGVLVFYVMLVFAPRQLAEREGSPGQWVARFLVFLASLIAGSTLGGALGR